MRKNLLSLVVIFSIITGGKAIAQTSSTATATASVKVVTPITLTKTVDLNFGIVVPSGTPGTMTLTPLGVRTPNGGVSVLSATGMVTPALFAISGEDGYAFGITLPGTQVALTNGGGQTMYVSDFTSFPPVATGGTLNGGVHTLTVGGILHVNANQASGTYTTQTPFSVTVNYN
ncbi:DUF4402 domain-containing protein [Chitinophaga flava]|uniref:DUF4402 domain-containing protein n=1 Tax=Chitinophaga flava TaxID=2259036 RepID=A0A365XUG6_9BACT|nr:DUF4402 domain-containing protein [Chitinophaga flava]RBL89758.1 hypothetical protein DF182_25025 [Chitinophaga flava]